MNIDDDDVRKYIHVKLRNKSVTFKDGKKFPSSPTYRVKPCKSEDFKTSYGKKFYERNKKDVLHCVENPKVFL